MEKKRLTASKVILFTILFILTAVVMVPFLWSILLSFKTNNEIVNAPTALPAVFNFDNYVRALETLDLPSMYKNTIIIAVVAEFITLIITFMSSFAISRLVFRKERNRKALYLSLIHISEPTRRTPISDAVFCLKKFFFNDTATTEIYTV